MLAGVLRQSMALHLDELLKEPPRRGPESLGEPIESIVGIVDKERLLEVVEEIHSDEVAKEHALQIAHEENLSAWLSRIGAWRSEHAGQDVALLELVRSLNMPLIKVWIALLLGGYHLEQRGEFYDTTQVWVTA